MEYIKVTSANIEKEYIWSALSNNGEVYEIKKQEWNVV